MTKEGEPNPKAASLYTKFQQLLETAPISGALRVHLVFPNVQGGTPKTEVQGNDIMVYIDCDNMDKFFYEGIRPGKENMASIKKVIKYIGKF